MHSIPLDFFPPILRTMRATRQSNSCTQDFDCRHTLCCRCNIVDICLELEVLYLLEETISKTAPNVLYNFATACHRGHILISRRWIQLFRCPSYGNIDHLPLWYRHFFWRLPAFCRFKHQQRKKPLVSSTHDQHNNNCFVPTYHPDLPFFFLSLDFLFCNEFRWFGGVLFILLSFFPRNDLMQGFGVQNNILVFHQRWRW